MNLVVKLFIQAFQLILEVGMETLLIVFSWKLSIGHLFLARAINICLPDLTTLTYFIRNIIPVFSTSSLAVSSLHEVTRAFWQRTRLVC